MEYHIFSLAIVALVLLISTARGFPWFSPMAINALVWLIVFAVGVFVGQDYYPIRYQVFLSWLIFFVGSSGVYFFLCPVKVSSSAVPPTPPRHIPFNYLSLLGLLIVWLTFRVWDVGSGGPAHFFLNLRLSSNGHDEFEPLGFVGRFYPLIFALFLFEHIYPTKANRHLRILLWIWILLFAIATMSKFAILTPVLAWVTIQGVLGRIKPTFLAPFLTLAVILMLALHFIRAGERDESTVLDLIGVYIYSPIVALGYWPIDSTLPFGSYVFRFFYAIGFSLGIAEKPMDTIMSYVEIPMLTNVYTVIQPFYNDFGLIGVVFGTVLFSGFFSALYRAAIRNRTVGLMLYSGFMVVLFCQFFADLLVTTLSGNIQLAICTYLVYMSSRKGVYVN